MSAQIIALSLAGMMCPDGRAVECALDAGISGQQQCYVFAFVLCAAD